MRSIANRTTFSAVAGRTHVAMARAVALGRRSVGTEGGAEQTPGQRAGVNVKKEGKDHELEHKELGSGGEGGNFKHMAKTGEGPWRADKTTDTPHVVSGDGCVGEPGIEERLGRDRSLVGDEIVHTSADPEEAGSDSALLEEDFAAEADWRRVGNETAGGPSVFDHERPHHILHQGYHGPPPPDSHVHREDLKKSDSSQGM